MNDKFFIQQPIRPIGQPIEKYNGKAKPDKNHSSFHEVFQTQLAENREIKFSKHAQERLSLRDIKLNQEAITKLNTAIDKAAKKGAKESLILMNDLAFVVSVQNKTVITAINGANIKDNVFTNIDSAVVI